MHHGVRLEFLKNTFYDRIITKIGFPELRLDPTRFFQSSQAFLHRHNGCCAARSHLFDPLPPQKQVRACHIMSSCRKILRQRPTEIAIHPCDKNTHTVFSPDLLLKSDDVLSPPCGGLLFAEKNRIHPAIWPWQSSPLCDEMPGAAAHPQKWEVNGQTGVSPKQEP